MVNMAEVKAVMPEAKGSHPHDFPERHDHGSEMRI